MAKITASFFAASIIVAGCWITPALPADLAGAQSSADRKLIADSRPVINPRSISLQKKRSNSNRVPMRLASRFEEVTSDHVLTGRPSLMLGVAF